MPQSLQCCHCQQLIYVPPDMLEASEYLVPTFNPTYGATNGTTSSPTVTVKKAELYDNADPDDDNGEKIDLALFERDDTIKITDSSTDAGYLDVSAPLDEAIKKHLTSSNTNIEILQNFLAHFRSQSPGTARYTCAFLEVIANQAYSLATQSNADYETGQPFYDQGASKNYGTAETVFSATYDNPVLVETAMYDNPQNAQAAATAAQRKPTSVRVKHGVAANSVAPVTTPLIPELEKSGFVVFPCAHIYCAKCMNKFRNAQRMVPTLTIQGEHLTCNKAGASCNAAFTLFNAGGFAFPIHFGVPAKVVQNLVKIPPVVFEEALYETPGDVRKRSESTSWARSFFCCPSWPIRRVWTLRIFLAALGAAGAALAIAQYPFGKLVPGSSPGAQSLDSILPPSNATDTSCLTPIEATLFHALQEAIPGLSTLANVTCTRIAETMTTVCANISSLNPANATVQDYSRTIATGLSVLGSIGMTALQQSQINALLLSCLYTGGNTTTVRPPMTNASVTGANITIPTTIVPTTRIETTVETTTTPTPTTSTSSSTSTATTTTMITTTFVGTTVATVLTTNAATSALASSTAQSSPASITSTPVPTSTATTTAISAATATTQFLTTQATTTPGLTTLLQPTTTTTQTTPTPTTSSSTSSSTSTSSTSTTTNPTTTTTSTSTPTSSSSSTTTTTTSSTSTTSTSTSTTTTTTTTNATTTLSTTTTTTATTTVHRNTVSGGGGRRRAVTVKVVTPTQNTTVTVEVDRAALRVAALALRVQNSMIEVSSSLNAFTTPHSWRLWGTQQFSNFWNLGTGRSFTLITGQMTYNLTLFAQNRLYEITQNATRTPTLDDIFEVSRTTAEWFTEHNQVVAESEVSILGPLGLFEQVSKRFATNIVQVNLAIYELLNESFARQYGYNLKRQHRIDTRSRRRARYYGR